MSEVDQKLSCKPFLILEKLLLRNMRRLETIIQGSIKTVKVFEKLQQIKVAGCNKLKYLFPLSIMEGLSSLQYISVRDCEMMEAIVVVENEQQAEAANKIIEFRPLRDLTLKSLPRLRSICCKPKAKGLIQSQSSTEIEELEDQLIPDSFAPFDGQVAFPNLKSIHIAQVCNMNNIWLDQRIAFGKFGIIHLSGRENLKNVFVDETMRNIEELKSLHVFDCYLLEEVFRIQKSDEKNEGGIVAFSSQLEFLYLRNLTNLKQVWNLKDDIEGIRVSFQNLTDVRVEECPKLERLFPPTLTKHLQQLQEIFISHCGIDEIFAMEESELECSQISFPNLNSLKIEHADKLEMIWNNQLMVDDMSKLQTVKLDNCKSLKTIFTSNVMTALKELETLDIQNCDSVEEVFEIHHKSNVEYEEEDDHEVATIKLKKLQLCNLPSLKHVWSNDPNGMYRFQDLHDIMVIKCPKLTCPFPSSLTRELQQQLQCLHVDDFVDAILMKQETSSPKTSEVDDKLEKGAFIRLTRLELYGTKVIKEVCHPKFSREFFPALKALKLKNLDDYDSTPFSLEFLRLLYSLEELEVCNASLVEIFPYDRIITNEENQSRGYSTPLKKLRLIELPKVTYVWKEIQPSFDNLEAIHVANCGELNTLVVMSSFSFQNLKQLTILKCDGLNDLLHPSVAKTLVHLKTMELCECKSMITILAEWEDRRGDDEIIFPKLEALKLRDLPQLKGFQFPKFIIRFPYLKTLTIQQCPEMKIFSPGIVYAPLLKYIGVGTHYNYGDIREHKCWAGDVNATVQKLWEDNQSAKGYS